jgi:periplasmic protein TonB
MTLDIIETQNRKKAAIYTGVVVVTLLLLFRFIVLFEGNDLVKEDYGIEVALGNSDTGFGNDPLPSAEKEITPQPIITPDKIIEKAPVPRVIEEDLTDLTGTEPSDVKIKPIKKPITKPIKEVVIKPTPKPSPVVIKPTPATPTTPQKTRTVFSGGKGTTGGSAGDGKPGETGYKGDPTGTAGRTVFKGKAGTGGDGDGGSGGGGGTPSSSVAIAGWTWSRPPVVNDDSDDIGTIKFNIKLNSDGELISISTLSQGAISTSVVNQYRDAIKRLKFVPKGSGTHDEVSTGTITIRITAKN